ncbi:HAD family hydrolase [Aridibaculum aurantiacum]|uniref:HAD family hydrolase n=1 Tax=Aridibaculum aurantiacum TaxID=2810307 RepID=UPI001A956ED4|nr:HAD family phosphatase [Aridibaculum aurantiacum]
MENFRNIIFDLGGIFIDIDYFKTENAFIELGVTNFSELYNQHHANPLFEQLETGKLDENGFYQAFREATQLELSDKQIKEAWNAMLGTFAPEKLEWLKEISNRYKIYLFSNTNAIHYDCFQQIFRDNTGYKNFDDFFIKAHYSHKIGVRKPYPEAFTKLLEIEGLEADETLFIDDTPKNIDGARQAGLHTILLQSPKTVLDLDL